MNREIKFRGFSKELNSCVYGFLQEVDVEGVGYFYIFWQGNTTFVEANSVGQFTGFKDFDGKEIYEGDIFKLGAEKEVFEVRFEHGCFMAFCNGKQYGLIGELQICFIDIIGNIYQNAGLL